MTRGIERATIFYRKEKVRDGRGRRKIGPEIKRPGRLVEKGGSEEKPKDDKNKDDNSWNDLD